MKKNTKKQLINITVLIILTSIMLITLLNSTDELNFSNLKNFITNCDLKYILLAVLCGIGFIFFEALSLHIILKTLGHKQKFKSSIAYATSDAYYSAITPSASGGQPASAYYMIKDGVPGGTSGFTLIFNLTGYTFAILVLGIFGFIFGQDIFQSFSSFVKILIIVGFFLQVGLLLFFIACMKYCKLVRKIGYLFIDLLCKIKIIRKREKWIAKLDTVIDKYSSCYEGFQKNKLTMIPVIICNILQRASQTSLVNKSQFHHVVANANYKYQMVSLGLKQHE